MQSKQSKLQSLAKLHAKLRISNIITIGAVSVVSILLFSLFDFSLDTVLTLGLMASGILFAFGLQLFYLLRFTSRLTVLPALRAASKLLILSVSGILVGLLFWLRGTIGSKSFWSPLLLLGFIVMAVLFLCHAIYLLWVTKPFKASLPTVTIRASKSALLRHQGVVTLNTILALFLPFALYLTLFVGSSMPFYPLLYSGTGGAFLALMLLVYLMIYSPVLIGFLFILRRYRKAFGTNPEDFAFLCHTFRFLNALFIIPAFSYLLQIIVLLLVNSPFVESADLVSFIGDGWTFAVAALCHLWPLLLLSIFGYLVFYRSAPPELRNYYKAPSSYDRSLD